MYHPTTRVLAVLALLQTHGRMSGADLAARLEVNVRTLRRYILMLQDLGIPIEAERGRICAAGHNDLVLVVVADPAANIGMIRVEMIKAAGALP